MQEEDAAGSGYKNEKASRRAAGGIAKAANAAVLAAESTSRRRSARIRSGTREYCVRYSPLFESLQKALVHPYQQAGPSPMSHGGYGG